MQKLRQLHLQLLEDISTPFHRLFYDDFQFELRHMGIVGPRGIGKTTFLLDYIRKNYQESDKALYISADHLYFSQNTLLEVAQQFYQLYQGELLCIDEIHKYKNWNQELKNIYDFLPNLKVIFSGSSSIDLIKGSYDLSRRALLKPMYGFSFREYLEIKLKTKLPILSLDKVVLEGSKQAAILMKIPKLLGYFKEYLQCGYYPTSLEIPQKTSFYKTLISILDKSIYEDLSSFYSLKTEHLQSLKKIMYFFATSEPGEISINKLANSLGHDHSTVADYVQKLQEMSLLRFLLIDKQGHVLVRNTKKIYLDNTNLLYAINTSIGREIKVGTLRENFVVQSLQNSGQIVTYNKQANITCARYTFEIGGKNKDKKQIAGLKNAYLVLDDILAGDNQILPLWLFGFLG